MPVVSYLNYSKIRHTFLHDASDVTTFMETHAFATSVTFLCITQGIFSV